MLREIEELKKQCEAEVKSLKREIQAAKGNFFLRLDAKATIQKAQTKIEQIQQLLMKLEGLSDQVMPVVQDLKGIVGLKQVGKK